LHRLTPLSRTSNIIFFSFKSHPILPVKAVLIGAKEAGVKTEQLLCRGKVEMGLIKLNIPQMRDNKRVCEFLKLHPEHIKG